MTMKNPDQADWRERPSDANAQDALRRALRTYARLMIEVWRNLAVDDDAWQRYCTLTGRDPARTMRPIDPFPGHHLDV